jgi:hypothetical protein
MSGIVSGPDCHSVLTVLWYCPTEANWLQRPRMLFIIATAHHHRRNGRRSQRTDAAVITSPPPPARAFSRVACAEQQSATRQHYSEIGDPEVRCDHSVGEGGKVGRAALSDDDVVATRQLGMGSFCCPSSAAARAARHAPTMTGGPSPVPRRHPRSPICRGSGVHPHPHPRCAGDRGSSPSPVPIGGSVPCHGAAR